MPRYIALCALLVACGGDEHTTIEVDGGSSSVNHTTVIRGVCIGVECPRGGIEGDGTTVSEPRALRGFDAIVNETPLPATVTQGDFKVDVSWDGNLVAKVLTVIEGGTLHLRIDEAQSITSTKVGSVAVSLPQLRAFATTGSGDATLSGSADSVELSSSGSGDIDASNFTAAQGKVTTSGSGDIRATFTRSVRASSSGSGDIDLYGGGTVTESESGSGDITAH